MRQIKEHKRLEDDRLQGKGKTPTTPQLQREHQLWAFSKGLEGRQRDKKMSGDAER